MKKIFLIALGLMVGACSGGPGQVKNDRVDWISNSDFVIRIHPKEKFELCKGANCGQGKIERPFGKDSPNIVLKDIFLLRDGRDLLELFQQEYPESLPMVSDYPDLDFTPNFNIEKPQAGPPICQGNPCFYAGSVEDFSQGLVFYVDAT